MGTLSAFLYVYKMIFYDIHTHAETVNGVVGIVNAYPSSFAGLGDSFYCSCGVHPWYTANGRQDLIQLESIANNPRVLAIGEAGYDSLKGESLPEQKIVFEKQIELSERLGKPMIIHCVKAWGELLSSYKEYQPKQPWVLHGFRGNVEQMNQLLAKGFLFSIGAKFNEQTVKGIPLDCLFLETDDSPVMIDCIYAQVAEVKGLSIQNLSEIVENNVKRVFSGMLD